MANEALRGRSLGSHHDCRHVSALAHQTPTWGVVPQHGIPWLSGIVFRDGHRQAHPILCDGREYAEGILAVPESL